MNIEDAETMIIQWIKDGSPSPYPNYGYDVYIPNVIGEYLRSQDLDSDREDGYRMAEELSPVFYAAAWDLCRRGILRPGIKVMREQSTDDGNAGNGYSLTPFGLEWVGADHTPTFLPIESGRFSELVRPHEQRFGPGFHNRADQALRCYRAQAYLACCVMCGAAAESILLATAIAKESDEEKVLQDYAGAQGRGRLERRVIGQAKEHTKREFLGYLALLKYWRDEGAHGKALEISDNEAYISIALLLRFAMFMNENWEDLTN